MAESRCEYFMSLGEAAEDIRVEPTELLSCGEHVVGLGDYSGRSRSTGRDFNARFAHVMTVVDDRVTVMRGYEDTATIRAAFDGESS
jgi:ketosteroid isomerase-like protein